MAPRSFVQHLTVAVGLAAPLASAYASHTSHQINYTTVTGYFLQDLNTTDPSTFDYSANNFGLINRTYEGQSDCDPDIAGLTQWQKFSRELKRLNKRAPKNVEYKLLFLGRHGEGFHNAAESYYGTPAWNCYWSEESGNGTSYWEDAHLTVNGIAQAQKAHDFWAKEIKEQKIYTPDSYYVSPLSRCLSTASITFSNLTLPRSKPFVPTVKEYLREGISVHTCDHRSNKTYIKESFPTYKIEKGFAEFDPLWNGITAESSSAQDIRSKVVLDEIFSSDKGTVLSITSHSGEISSILRVFGHQKFSLSTGAVIPVLVKAETLKRAPTPTSATWGLSPHCTSPPLASGTAGCVCQSSAAPVTTPLIEVSPTVSPIITFTARVA